MLIIIVYSPYTVSAIQIMATRVILDAGSKEQTFVIRNTGDRPLLLQTWLSKIDYDGMDIRDDVPLFITPPVGRINPGKNKVFRLFQSDEAKSVLPRDRESAFWINAFDLPATTQQENTGNQLHIAFRTRIKAFYRPKEIEGTLIEAASKLTWTVRQNKNRVELTTKNSSPYHISFANFALMNGEKEQAGIAGGMVAPYSSKTFIFNNANWYGEKRIRYNYISDPGGFITVTFKP